MRCRACNYPLWNLRERICPECGTAFRPSDYDLVPSAVRFCCRACMQPYYGMTWRGHLDPVEFNCVRCGERVHMDECILLPTEGVDEERTQQGYNPWLDRRRGLPARFFSAIGHAMVNPIGLARGTPIDSPVGTAAALAIAVNAGVYAVCWSPYALLSLSRGWSGVWIAATFIGFFLAMSMVGALLWGLLAHAMLRMTGKTAGTLRRTYHAIFYSAGANTLSALLCMGWMFGWVWWIVSACLMIKEMQRVSGVRAAAAGIVPPIVCVFGGSFAYVGLVMLLGVGARGVGPGRSGLPAWPPSIATPSTASSPTGAAQHLGAQIVKLAEQNGRFPAHPGELIAYRQVPVSALAASGSSTTDETATIGGRTVRELDLLAPGERLQAFQLHMDREAADAGGPSPWRRLGDLVMPHLGDVTPEAARGAGLWVVVVTPDPAANGGLAPTGEIIAVGVDGSAEAFWPADLGQRLDAQNAARRGLGLPDLTDPRDVLHWTAPGG